MRCGRWAAVSARRPDPLRGAGDLRPSLSEGRSGRSEVVSLLPAGCRVLRGLSPLGRVNRVCESLRQRE